MAVVLVEVELVERWTRGAMTVEVADCTAGLGVGVDRVVVGVVLAVVPEVC